MTGVWFSSTRNRNDQIREQKTKVSHTQLMKLQTGQTTRNKPMAAWQCRRILQTGSDITWHGRRSCRLLRTGRMMKVEKERASSSSSVWFLVAACLQTRNRAQHERLLQAAPYITVWSKRLYKELIPIISYYFKFIFYQQSWEKKTYQHYSEKCWNIRHDNQHLKKHLISIEIWKFQHESWRIKALNRNLVLSDLKSTC